MWLKFAGALKRNQRVRLLSHKCWTLMWCSPMPALSYNWQLQLGNFRGCFSRRQVHQVGQFRIQCNKKELRISAIGVAMRFALNLHSQSSRLGPCQNRLPIGSSMRIFLRAYALGFRRSNAEKHLFAQSTARPSAYLQFVRAWRAGVTRARRARRGVR